MVILIFKNNTMKKLIKALVIPIIALITVLSSCDYRKIGDVDYGSQKIYIPAAAVADGAGGFNGFFNISALATPDRSFRYIIDKDKRKLNIPLSVLRSGAILSGVVKVDITIQTDSVNKLINNGVLKGTNTFVLPATAFSMESSVTIPSGEGTAGFTLSVNLDYLIANINNKQAIGLKVTSDQIASNPKYGTAIIYIDPQFLVPTANFAFLLNTGTKKVDFNNTSINGLTYSWNYGDASAIETTKSPSHTYANSGTYNVTLTTLGALGDENKSVLSKTVTVP